MAQPNVKFAQKLSADSFKRLMDQQKNEGVHVVYGIDPTVAAVSTDHLLGRVQGIYNLGKKLDVYLELKDWNGRSKIEGEFRFVQTPANVFYLVRKEGH
jgi:hypothetical protein